MLAGRHESHFSPRKFIAHAFHLAGFGARLEAPVKKQRRHAKLTQPAVVKIFVGALNHVGDSQPGTAVTARHVLPVVISVILPEHLACFFAEAFRMRSKPFKKTSRVWFVSEEVKRFKNQQLTSLRRPHSEHRTNHGAVTMTPEHGAPDSECIQKRHRLLRGPLMKIRRHLAGHARRVLVSGSVVDQNPQLALKTLVPYATRIQSTAPAGIGKNNASFAPS